MGQARRRRDKQKADLSLVRRSTPSKGGVAVAYCHPHELDATFHGCVVQMLCYDAKTKRRIIDHGDVIDTLSGPRIASARNEMCRAFLAHPHQPEWLWMVDTDMVFPRDILDRYLEVADPDESPIVGGLCFIGGGGSGKVEPTLKVLRQNGDGAPKFETIWDYPENTLVQIDATGAACLMIHRKVIKALDEKYGETSHPWFAESSNTRAEFGEDITFCIRARDAGFPIKVHTGIRIGHVKPQVIDQDTYLEYRRGITAAEKANPGNGEMDYAKSQLARRGTQGWVV